MLVAADAALGFDWTGWYDFLAPHRNLRFVLWLAYLSLLPQILISIFWFSRQDLNNFNYELLFNNIVSLLITTAIFLMFPVLGHQETARGLDLPVLLALRGGGPWSFDLAQLQGLISFPSYHTVLAVLLTYAHRRSRLLLPIALVNGIMLFSIPSYGEHYLIDLVPAPPKNCWRLGDRGSASSVHHARENRLSISRARSDDVGDQTSVVCRATIP